MKCPKCGYLGFETVERCRNCGYDFSLGTHPATPGELPLQQSEGAGVPLADFDLATSATAHESDAALDLDRILGTDEDDTPPPSPPGPPAPAPEPRREEGLPLFTPAPSRGEEMPLVAPPRPARPPLSVRRATPDLSRARPRPSRPRPDDAPLDLAPDEPPETLEPEPVRAPVREPDVETWVRPNASRGARLAAMFLDLLFLGAIDATVVYLTLAMARLPFGELLRLPLVPLAAFLLLLNGGYLVAFTAAGGQTIGKMLTRIRVVADDGARVDVGRAVLRAAGCLLTLLTAGLGYLPAIFSADARALQDRVAGTRVVRLQ